MSSPAPTIILNWSRLRSSTSARTGHSSKLPDSADDGCQPADNRRRRNREGSPNHGNSPTSAGCPSALLAGIDRFPDEMQICGHTNCDVLKYPPRAAPMLHRSRDPPLSHRLAHSFFLLPSHPQFLLTSYQRTSSHLRR